MQTKRFAIGALLAAICCGPIFSQNSLPSDIERQISSYNVVWNTPSTSGSLESMPLGNGDITANVWVESGGDIVFYIGKSDTWSEATRLLKVGRVRISLEPNPFIDVQGYSQELNILKGEIDISAGKKGARTDIKIYIDANRPVINVETRSDRPVEVICVTEIMRPETVTFNGGVDDQLSSSYRGLIDSPVKPSESADVKVSAIDRIEWYHRNGHSFFRTMLEKQNVGELADKYDDPYLGLTFGAAISGKGMKAANDTTLRSVKASRHHHAAIHVLTSKTETADQWCRQIDKLISDNQYDKSAYTKHLMWWNDFWDRSWVLISGDEKAEAITRAYLLQRYMMACQSRGAQPVKFNGGTLTFDFKGKNGDYRNWGAGYWYQNCRLYYWPLTASGDFEMKKPWFDMYMKALPLQKDITKIIYGHDGAFFPETMNFFGMYIQDDWGWNNTGKASQTRWIRYHYEGALEMLAEMIDFYKHTEDKAFVHDYIVPFASEVIRFFFMHWPTINGQINFIPANSLEQYWDCLNPIDYIAGLRYDIEQLNEMPDDIMPVNLKEEWNGYLASLPGMPRSTDGSRLLPAEEFGQGRNFENPECYAIFPFRFYGLGRPDYEIGLNTFNARKFNQSNCWSQCAIQAACLGLSELMPDYLFRNATAIDPEIRFPAFWKPGSDYVPDLDNGGVLANGVQNMLLQNIGDSILVLGALPECWHVDFKLHAYGNTTVRVKATGQKIHDLEVCPAFRKADVIQRQGLTVQ